MTENKSRFSPRTKALFWLVLVGIIIGILVGYQMISLLYVLATLTLVILLLIVAFADLEKVSRESIEGFAPKGE
jgi:hypothetical protein